MNMLQTIQAGAIRQPVQGMSDQARADELKAQQLVLPAVAALRSALQDAMLLTSAMQDQLSDLLGALLDNAPTLEQWEDQIAELAAANWTGSYRRGVL